MVKYKFKNLIVEKDGLIKGPFGGDIKKSLFVPKDTTTYKVYEQGVVYAKNMGVGSYYISAAYFEKKLKRFEIKPGDILISGAGTLGDIFEVPQTFEKGVINQALIRVRLDENIVHKGFFKYYFQHFIKKIACRLNGDSVIPNLPPLSVLKEIEFDLPPFEIQEKISRVLSSLDKKIECNNKISAELEALAKTIYDYWFLQFEFPNDEGKPYRSSGGKMVWSEELKREIPEGWEVKEIGEFISTNRGISYSGKNLHETGVPMINLATFSPASMYKAEGLKMFSGEYSSDKILKPYDLVMCNTQQTDLDPAKDIIGKSFLIPDIFDSEIISSHHVTTIKTTTPNLKYYLNGLFRTPYFHKYISGYVTGTSIMGLNIEGVTKFRCPIPTNRVLDKFAYLSQKIEEDKSRLIKENRELTSLRDYLLPLLMNGQVGFKE